MAGDRRAPACEGRPGGPVRSGSLPGRSPDSRTSAWVGYPGREAAIAAAVQAAATWAHRQLAEPIAAGVSAGEWSRDTDPALAARLFTASLYGLMAQWHLAPGSFSWDAAASLAAADGGSAASPPGPGSPPAVSVA